MSLGEIAGWAGLALSALVGVLLYMHTRRMERMERQIRSLMKGAGPGAERMSLGELVAGQANRLDAARAEVEKLRQEVRALDASMARTVQHVGLVRFNPFDDTGGDQSFALALLDKVGNGVVISSLHGRTTTRFYAKAVKADQPGLSLSEEEAMALKQAKSEA